MYKFYKFLQDKEGQGGGETPETKEVKEVKSDEAKKEVMISLTPDEYKNLLKKQVASEKEVKEVKTEEKKKTQVLEVDPYKKSYIDGLLKEKLGKYSLEHYFERKKAKLLSAYSLEDPKLIVAKVEEIALGIKVEIDELKTEIAEEEAERIKNTDTKITTKGVESNEEVTLGSIIGDFINGNEADAKLEDFE